MLAKNRQKIRRREEGDEEECQDGQDGHDVECYTQRRSPRGDAPQEGQSRGSEPGFR